ncbi:MAG: PduL/EutD family phosphate acyltransferase, partial [Candidatus Woesearchaeota archaeon]
MKPIPIEISNKHVHFSQKDMDILFGENYKLTKIKDLSQPGEFAAEEKVEIEHLGNKLSLRVLGPIRDKTQIELSLTDIVILKLQLNGFIVESPEVKLTGPKGTIFIKDHIQIVKRHLHCTPEDVQKLDLKDKVDILVPGERAVVFKDVIVRVSPNFK